MEQEFSTHLNKAAYCILNGGILVGFDGKFHHNCKVKVRVDPEIYYNAKKGMVNYQKYMEVRSKIKMKMRKAYGLRPLP